LSFGWPIALVGLVLVPVLAAAYVWNERRRKRAQAAFGNPALLPNVVDRSPGRLRALPVAVGLVGLAAMIVGVARPHATVSVPREEATIVLAVDVSRSMKATDVLPTRLDAARTAAREFLAEVPEKFRVAVVSFATRAAVGVAPTEDRSLVEAALDSLVPGEGTALGDAVALSLQVGRRDERAERGDKQEPPPPRAILVVSDGARDGGRVEPDRAAALAKEQGVPVYSVLVGTGDGVVEETLPGGLRRIIRVPPSPETLEKLSVETGGELFAAPDPEQLRRVYEELGSRLGSKEESREITDVFAAVATAFVLVAAALSAFLFRRVP
jgi:Ca-activated chloride channel family protein